MLAENLRDVHQAEVQSAIGRNVGLAASRPDLRLRWRRAAEPHVARRIAAWRTPHVSLGSREVSSEACCWSRALTKARRGRRSSSARAAFIGCAWAFKTRTHVRHLTEAFFEELGSRRAFAPPQQTHPIDSCWFAGDGWWLSTADA